MVGVVWYRYMYLVQKASSVSQHEKGWMGYVSISQDTTSGNGNATLCLSNRRTTPRPPHKYVMRWVTCAHNFTRVHLPAAILRSPSMYVQTHLRIRPKEKGIKKDLFRVRVMSACIKFCNFFFIFYFFFWGGGSGELVERNEL